MSTTSLKASGSSARSLGASLGIPRRRVPSTREGGIPSASEAEGGGAWRAVKREVDTAHFASPAASLGEAKRSGVGSSPAAKYRKWKSHGRKAVGPPCVVLVVSQFHPAIARSLVRGATDALRRGGVTSIELCWVPGAFELPVVASRCARMAPRPHAIVALGALIQGDTPQYEVLAHAVAHGLTTVALTSGIPVTFGLIVATTLAQAKARAGGSMGHRGAEAARAALDVMRLFSKMRASVVHSR